MATKEEIARKRAEKRKARAAELLRLAKQDDKTAAEIERNKDTHRKILEGVTAIYGCAHSEEFRRMHEQFRHKALTLNKDRAVFGLPLLPEEENARRGRSAEALAAAPDAHARSSGASASIAEKETEDA